MKVNLKEIISKILRKQKEDKRIKFFTAISTMLAVIITIIFIVYFKCHQSNMASTKLALVYTSFAQGNQKQGIELLDEMISKYPKMPAAYQARLLKADISTQLGVYEEALKLLNDTVKDGKPEKIKPLAQVRIIYVFDTKRDYFNAINASKDFVNKYSDHFLIKDIYLNLAEYYLLSGSKDEALKTFNEILINFPATPEAEKAQKRINEIK
ncbi:MAG: tetratricopeptide repeat protein [Endomicrobium sp.]|jgi:predicted negative regulator of RcsB-dependent stress response|uniref:tetratricopeptide repeat protein n=1 Tax=Candidatus Endomicrobiellum cubanum TaxID=3242325 RepID=UPI0028327512|nr:tetratricopeptide repeat protein [Endomicrobium sp.]